MPLKVRIGGLMRCCIETLKELDERGELPTEPGSTVHCLYEKPEKPDSMRLANDGVWEWSGS